MRLGLDAVKIAIGMKTTVELMNELRLLCNDNGIELEDVATIRGGAQKFGTPIVATYRLAKSFNLLSYQKKSVLP